MALTEFTKKGDPLFKCRAGCEQEAVIAALQAKGYWPIPGSVPKVANEQTITHRSPEERREYARSIFRGVKAQNWDPKLAKKYFSNRGLKNIPTNARLTMPIPKGSKEQLLSEIPGIVFQVMDRHKKFLGIHVIWLNGDLTGKREAKPHRQCHGPIKGGYIKIGELDPDKPLVVAEGVETAMAVLQITNLPCALVGCGANTADVNLPSHSEYIIAADNDDAGQKTATKLAQRHAGPDCKIRIATPDKPKGGKKGYDWNDALMAGVDPKLMRRAILKAPVFEDVGADEDDADHDKNKKKDKQALALAKLERIPVM